MKRLEDHVMAKNCLRIEVLFFLAYFIVFPIFTSVEYNWYEQNNILLFLNDVPERLIYGFFNIIPFWLYYKLLLHRYLFKRQYFRFLFCLLLFLVALNYYKLATYWVVSITSMLPENVRQNALTWLMAPNLIHFSLVYIIRELVVVTALAYFLRNIENEKRIQHILGQQLQSELKYLKVQLQPHFFFNTLNNIYALALQKSDQTAPLVAKHADMMRYILQESGNQMVSLESEIAFLENYIAVESVRFSDKIAIRFEVQGVDSGVRIEPLLLLPFVENVFKHGLREEIVTGFAEFIICLLDTELVFEVRNSKPQPSVTQVGEGIGLANVKKRLDLLYSDLYKLENNESPQQYEILLTIHLKQK